MSDGHPHERQDRHSTGSSATASEEYGSRAGPAFQADDEGRDAPMNSDWPLRSYLELAALPGAVPCARLHTRQVLWEWGQGVSVEAVELLVSEIVTNAVQASAGLASRRRDGANADRSPTVRFWLAADGQQVLIQVWDSCQRKPERQDAGLEAESGRGLLLVEALSSDWGSFAESHHDGKMVWALVTAVT